MSNDEVEINGLTPLDFFRAVWMNPQVPLGTRLKAASEHAKYMHPRLAVVTTTTEQDLVERMERALAATAKVINSRAVQVIEPPKPKPQIDEPPPDHSKPFAHDNKSRFRRL